MSVHLHSLTQQFLESETFAKSLKILLRCFRNIAANSNSQSYIIHHTYLFEDITKLFDFVFSRDNCQRYLKIPLQLFINLISANGKVVDVVYQKCSELVKQCMVKEYHIYECSAFFYNASRLMEISDCEVFKEMTQQLDTNNESEYTRFFLEDSILLKKFWESYYTFFLIEGKVKILHYLSNKLVKDKNINVDLSCIRILSKEFIDSTDIIFQINQDGEDFKVQFVTFLLKILSSMSGIEEYLRELQGNKDLFINMGVVLINIHKLGKMSDNCFTPVQKLSEIDDEELKEHPGFGFKAYLIRFLGNMCWKSPEMQNLVR